jgi:predicted nucleic acid-binding protein
MPTYFLDASALVKAYRREAGTPHVIELLDGSDPLIIARLTHVEVSSAIVRRGRGTGMSPDEIDTVLAAFDREIPETSK